METKTLKALKGSIKKWEKIERNVQALDKEEENCPLCKLFSDSCDACPAVKKKGRGCSETPYLQWYRHQRDEHCSFIHKHRAKDCPTCLDLATKERVFLESLLPVKKGEKK